VINRRTFLAGTGAVLLAAPLAAEGQQAGRVYRIGHISSGDWRESWPAFVEGLSSLGWVEGKNIVFEHREQVIPASLGSAGSNLQSLTEELVRIKVDVIVLVGGARAQAVQKVTSTIPIVTLAAGELVSSGIVASLARPGGNITGMQEFSPELQGKRLQILKELVPTLSRVAVLRRGAWHPGTLTAYQQTADDAAKKLGLRLRYVMFANPDELPCRFLACAGPGGRWLHREPRSAWSQPDRLRWDRERPRQRVGVVQGDGPRLEAPARLARPRLDGVFVGSPDLRVKFHSVILRLASARRLPMVGHRREWVEQGALFSYADNIRAIGRAAATRYIDRILKGAKPADLPVEEVSEFELVINLKTAKALGLTISPSLLLRADQIIE
jgi:putative ABC transport system substrate-binding protein